MLTCSIPKTVGVAMPIKATFFITYIMVDGWASIAAEVVRLVPLIKFHFKNSFFVNTELDREEAMGLDSVNFDVAEPRIQLYFLLGLVYSVVTPLILPFIIVFFAFAYTIYRHQVHIPRVHLSSKPMIVSALCVQTNMLIFYV